MKTLKEFKDFYNKSMHENLSLLEKRRKRILRFVLWSFLVAAIGILFTMASASLFFPKDDYYSLKVFVGVIISIIVAIVFFYVKGRDKTFYSDFKEQVIKAIVTFISPDLSYNPKNYIGLDSFQRSRIFLTNVDRYRGDDMVEGVVDKTKIWFSEINAEYKRVTTDSKGKTKTTWHRIFKGLFFIADFNKHFTTSTIVLPNRLGRSSFARFFQKMNISRREKHISLEDLEFNKYFVAYGEDQVEARYVLSTSLMKRITDFKKSHKNPVFISFVNSFLYVAIGYNKNLFEPSYFKKLNRFKIVQEYFEDIQLAVGIVEDLNLNNRIWTKQ